jgi:hypothetical protein
MGPLLGEKEFERIIESLEAAGGACVVLRN